MRTYKSIVEEPDKFENDHDVYLASLIDSQNEDLTQLNAEDPKEEEAVK